MGTGIVNSPMRACAAAARSLRLAENRDAWPVALARRWHLLLLILCTVSQLAEDLLIAGVENADRLITNKAVDTLPEEMQAFFQANRQFIVQHVIDPQQSVPKTLIPFERPRSNDSIKLDHYGTFPFCHASRAITTGVIRENTATGALSINTDFMLPWQIGVLQQAFSRMRSAIITGTSKCETFEGQQSWQSLASRRRTIPSRLL